MVTSLCIKLSTDQWINAAGVFISLLGVIATTWVAIWLGRRIQSRLTDHRNLKDYFISELIWIRDQYRTFDNDLLNGNVDSGDVLSRFKLISVRANDLLTSINDKCGIDTAVFKEFHLALLTLISDCESMVKGIRKNNKVVLTKAEKLQFSNIQQKYVHIFNDAVIRINETEYKRSKR